MFRGSMNLNITKKETFQTFFATLIVKDDFKPTVVIYIYYISYYYVTPPHKLPIKYKSILLSRLTRII